MDNIIFLSGFVAILICVCFMGSSFENGKQEGFKEGYLEGFKHGQHEVFNDFKEGLNKISKQN